MIRSKKAALRYVRSSAGIVILFAMFGGLLLYLYLVPPDVRETVLPPVEVEQTQTLFDVKPGRLSFIDEIWRSKAIRLNDVEIDNTLQEEKHIVNNNFEVSSTAFNQHDTEFRFLIDKSDMKSAALEFIVYDKSGDSNLKIYLNDKDIYSSKPAMGDNLRVELPFYDLNDGVNNIIITTSAQGALFWKTNSYTILNINLVTSEYNAKTASATQTFSLTQSEASNAENIELNAYVIQNSLEDANVELYLNNNRVFKAVPQANFVLDISSDMLEGGSNIIEWVVDRDGGYSIKQAIIDMDTIKTTGNKIDYIFNIGININRYIEKGYYDCNLVLERSSGGDRCIVNVNSEEKEVHFSSDIISIDICDDLKEGRNRVSFYTEDDDISLSEATLTLENAANE